MENKDIRVIAFFILILILLGGLVFELVNEEEVEEAPTQVVEEVVEEREDPFASLELEAQAIMVKDLKTGEVLYEKSPDKRLPLASLTKLMSALVASELLEEGTEVEITEAAIAVEGDSGLFLNERWRVNDLLSFILVTSSNDGSKAIDDVIQAKYNLDLVTVMNRRADDLGLSNTHFLNETGLDLSEQVSGAYGSARDITTLLDIATRDFYPLYKSTRNPRINLASLNYGVHQATNTNTHAGAFPQLLISKTGFTDLAGGNLAIVFDKELNHPISVVVLGSTVDGRFEDVEKLLWAAINS